jgi:hypothetical protein
LRSPPDWVSSGTASADLAPGSRTLGPRHRTASGERRMGECCGMSLEAKPREALRLSGGPVRDVLTTDPDDVATREYVFALPLDVMGNLARKLTEVYERQRGTTP